MHGQTDAVVGWCDLGPGCLRTVTLQIARQLKPMVIPYKTNPILYHLLVRGASPPGYFTLPNVISGEEVP